MRTITREAYEGDIVSRLRNWRGLHLAHGGRLFEEAADEIERLRSASVPAWRPRSEPPPPGEQVLFFTNHLNGFIWIGRRGLLPPDVSHWMPLPSAPVLDECAPGSHPAEPAQPST
jgi:hypothetical protein